MTDTMPEPAVAAGEDPRRYAQLLSSVYDAVMTGARPPARPREIVADSWRRLQRIGINPDHGATARPVSGDELDELRKASGLAEVYDGISHALESITADTENILVVADRAGRVLWRAGPSPVLTHADRLGFILGANWSESTVGTNAIGTALVSRRSVQIFSAEHYVRTHHAWTCAGAPVRDPRDGRVLGAIDVSGPARTVHPTTIALVDAVAKLTESQLREVHRKSLDRLRAVAAPVLAKSGGPALAIDAHGWVAAVEGIAPQNRLALPDQLTAGQTWLPALGLCVCEPIPGGWLVRPAREGAQDIQPTSVDIDLRTNSPQLTVAGPCGNWTTTLTPRHAEILYILATHRAGCTARQLAEHLFGDPSRAVTVRAELLRLRRHLGAVVLGQPYRFDPGAHVAVQIPDDPAQLLPASIAPAVVLAKTELTPAG
ncbi:GAF domain-containing protein [Hoyosella sp. YIM 151337]|uniref:helix-turn-helix domain-containing protein n=1 Tax=Hoyosella sp. YIM 151337 TaxID=2992742 RepID=UPI0022369D34|nr:helix-turn-helix domain-containing protein [Hoyosella sp. YIM 151337]MCW4353565.1 GAF domain-containing protein [Hoyosella sp. YIM 151337]